MARESFTTRDKEKVEFCLSCEVSECHPNSPSCPFNVRYGRNNDPKTLVQRSCGVAQRLEDLDIVKIKKRGLEVGRKLGIKIIYPKRTSGLKNHGAA